MTDKEDYFSAFWSVYPNRQAKKGASEKFNKLDLDTQRKIVSHVKERATSDKKWLAGYCPMPTTFISQMRWDDEYEVVAGKTSATVKEGTRQIICDYCRADTRGARHEDICINNTPYYDIVIKGELWKFAEGTMFQVHP